MNRVVITGYGAIDALGKNSKEVEKKLFDGQCGLGKKGFGTTENTVEGTVGQVKDYETCDSWFEEHKIPYDRCAQFALHAAKEAVEMAGLTLPAEDPYRVGTAIGTSLGGMLSGQKFHRQWLKEGLDQADENYLKAYPLHAIADIVASKFGFKGPKATISTACAASGNIIGYASDMIKNGKCNMMLAGGTDPLCSFSFAGFLSLKALDSEKCKPYSKSSGINLGEGGAFFILENYEHAKKRGAKIYGELLGYGLSADAYHPTAPDLGGGGASRAMEAGLVDGNVPKEKVAYVNGHGTGTVANDHAEKLACKKVFEDRISQIPISSIKGAIGHCLGAAGAQEAAACIMSLNNGKVPPTINFVHGEEDQAYNFVPDKSQERDCQVVMSNSFAFGGNNCSLVLGKAEENRKIVEKTKENIVITGMGCCGSGGRNIEELWNTFAERKSSVKQVKVRDRQILSCGIMEAVDWKKYIPGKYIRRIDEITKLTMTVGKQALNSSGLKVTRDNMERIGVIYGTGTGPMQTILNIDQSIVEKGIDSISLSEFPNSVINAAPGNFCIANMLKGPTSTMSVGDCSFLLAFTYAMEILDNDRADAVVVISADECNDDMLEAEDKLGLLSEGEFHPFTQKADGRALAPGAVALVIEKESHAKARKAKIKAFVKSYSTYSGTNDPIEIHSEKELTRCVTQAVKESGIPHTDLYVCSAMGVKEADDTDLMTMEELQKTGVLSEDTIYSSASPLIGSTQGSSSGYNVLDALYAFEKQEVPGTPDGWDALREQADGKYPQGENRKAQVKNACVSGLTFGGACMAVVLEKNED